MAKSLISASQETGVFAHHRTAHHAYGFQQVLSAVTHALAGKDAPGRKAAGVRAQRTVDKQRTAALSPTGSWAQMLLR